MLLILILVLELDILPLYRGKAVSGKDILVLFIVIINVEAKTTQKYRIFTVYCKQTIIRVR